MKVLLYRDSSGASRVWQNKFAEILENNNIEYVWVNFDNWFKRPKSGSKFLKLLKKYYQPGDYFVCRFNRERHTYLIPIYKQISEMFGDDHIFPKYSSFWYYDDKQKQMATYEKHNYHRPIQNWVQNQKELETFITENNLSYPLVRKDADGASSTGVSLITNNKIDYPCLIQDFWPNNDCDLRVNIIGSYAMTYKRLVRENDFRASGSGMLDYPSDIPQECMELAYQISKDHHFDCMSYDFIKDRNGKWGVVEMSYTFIDRYVTDVPYFYDCENNYKRICKKGITPEYFILNNLIPSIKQQ